jgi:peptidylprolyl isomerase
MRRSFLNLTRRAFFQKSQTGSLFNYTDPQNPKVFFNIQKNNVEIGKITFELYKNHCPKTAENFRQLCTGENTKKLTYKNSIFHRVINRFMAQGGDITRGNGTGGMSIYGSNFPDENLKLKHYKRGQLSMANAGPDTNSSQFFITFVDCPWLDGAHVVFGEVIEGENILKELEANGSQDGRPKALFKISDCGEIKKV